MTPDTARKVNAYLHTEALEAVLAYFKERIETNRNELEIATGDRLVALQGANLELRNLLKIRDYAIATLGKK